MLSAGSDHKHEVILYRQSHYSGPNSNCKLFKFADFYLGGNTYSNELRVEPIMLSAYNLSVGFLGCCS